MSMAICIKCGSRKISAWSQCEVCQHRSVDLEDLARSLYLSDNCRPPKELKDASCQIKEGNFTFQEEHLTRLIGELREQPALVERARDFRPFRLHPLF
jgi:hypothetical protein